jgi:hypothetical protein
VTKLLTQRDEWEVTKLTLDQTIAGFQQRCEEYEERLAQKDHEMDQKMNEMAQLHRKIEEGFLAGAEQNSKIIELEAEIARVKESETEMHEKFKATKIALTKEKAKVALYQSVNPVSSGHHNSYNNNTNNNSNNNLSSSSVNSGTNASTAGGPQEPQQTHQQQEQQAQQEQVPPPRPDSPYLLQEELRATVATLAAEVELVELDDEEEPAAAMRGLVPRLQHQAEIRGFLEGTEESIER